MTNTIIITGNEEQLDAFLADHAPNDLLQWGNTFGDLDALQALLVDAMFDVESSVEREAADRAVATVPSAGRKTPLPLYSALQTAADAYGLTVQWIVH